MDQSDIKVKLSISPESKTGRTVDGKLTRFMGKLFKEILTKVIITLER